MARRQQAKENAIERVTSTVYPDFRPDHGQGSEAAAQSKPRRDKAAVKAGPAPPPDAGLPSGLPSGLYVVATPIGNAADITLRALAVLAAVDVIACEDTRVTRKLLTIHGISRPLTAYHEHNADAVRPRLLARLAAGERIALVSDAGTPLISDPGFRLVRACIAADVPVVPLPGASAVLAALTVAGLPTDRFLSAGFLPTRRGPRRRTLAELAPVPATLLILESPHRLAASLADMADVLGDRAAVVTRELTKLFEETVRGTLAELAARYAASGPPKGEITVVIAPPFAAAPPAAADVDALLAEALADGSVKDAAARVAAATGLPKRTLYARALELEAKCR